MGGGRRSSSARRACSPPTWARCTISRAASSRIRGSSRGPSSSHARAVEDRGLLAAGRKFVERAFGMRPPAPFAEEPAAGGLFDFRRRRERASSRSWPRGQHAFRGGLAARARRAHRAAAFTARRQDENTWNACTAWAVGHAYVASTDPAFLEAYTAIMDELERRDGDRDGALGRDRTFREAETAATFYYALAVDALVVDGR